MAFTVNGLDGWAIPDLRIAVYSPRNTPGRRLPRTRRMAGRQAGWLARRLTAPVHRQGFAKTMKDIPGGSRRATGSTGTCPGYCDGRPRGPGERRSSSWCTAADSDG